MKLSVVVCTYNPKPVVFDKVLAALQVQTLEKDSWDLTIVDNCSTLPLSQRIDVSWHPLAKIVIEEKPGLSHARVAGVKASGSDLIVFADDDNVLAPDYLQKSYDFAAAHPAVGCFGGRSLPVFETEPPAWFQHAGISLGCQDFGSQVYISDYFAADFKITHYPEKAPIGTGMVIRKKAFLTYLAEAADSPERMHLGRRGKSLSSGEDNDINLSLVKNRYELAYVPELVVHHLIPANRYSEAYLKRMAFESNRTWVKVLQIHGINPWNKISKLSYGPRKVKTYLSCKAWQSPLSAIRWRSACGMFKGLSEI